MMLGRKKPATDPVAWIGGLKIQTANTVTRFANVMTPHQLAALKAIAPDLVVVAAGKVPKCPLHVWLWSKGSAKTKLAGAIVLYLLVCGKHGLEMRAGAADQEQSAEVRLAIGEWLRDNPKLATIVNVQNWVIDNHVTESRLAVVSSDSRSAHGARPCFTLIDELVHIADDSFVDTLLANATKVGGLVLIGSNAGIIGSWQHKKFQQWQQDSGCHVSVFAEPSPYISTSDLARLERTIPRSRFRRWYWTEWGTESDEGLPGPDIDRAFIPGLRPLLGPETTNRYYLGVDLGLKHDRAAAVALASPAGMRLACSRSWKPTLMPGGVREVDLGAVVRWIEEMHRLFHFCKVVFDSWNAGRCVQELREKGIPAEQQQIGPAFNQKAAVAVAAGLRDGRFRLYPDPDLDRDLRAARLTERAIGGYRLEWVRDSEGHGDVGSAFSICAAIATDATSFIWLPPTCNPEPNPGSCPPAGVFASGPGHYPGQPRDKNADSILLYEGTPGASRQSFDPSIPGIGYIPRDW